jgi:hypothetical protein
MNFSKNIALGIGDIIYYKAIFDSYKDIYNIVNFGLEMSLIEAFRPNKKDEYLDFILKFIDLLYKDDNRYTIESPGKFPFSPINDLLFDLNRIYHIPLQKPNYAKYLCKGESLNIGEYIVINTKVRNFNNAKYRQIYNVFYKILNELSLKYKIVILGEKEIERNVEYSCPANINNIFGLYRDIKNSISNITDLTVPALGITTPDIDKIQQDCLIMNEAKACITIGLGGGFCLSTAVGNTIGLRDDDKDVVAEYFYEGKSYNDAIITKDTNKFFTELRNI